LTLLVKSGKIIEILNNLGGNIMDFEKLQNLVVEGLGVSKEKVTLEADLSADLGADSLDAVELIMAIEDEFDITIDDEVAQSFKTIKEIVDFIESKE